jgi:hypothetical protein
VHLCSMGMEKPLKMTSQPALSLSILGLTLRTLGRCLLKLLPGKQNKENAKNRSRPLLIWLISTRRRLMFLSSQQGSQLRVFMFKVKMNQDFLLQAINLRHREYPSSL